MSPAMAQVLAVNNDAGQFDLDYFGDQPQITKAEFLMA